MFFITIQVLIQKYQNTLQQNSLMQSQHNRSRDDTQLPKIHSQKRIYTAIDRRATEEDTALANRPLSNNGRTKSLRAFTSKTVKYESTGNVYNKKIEQIQKQSFMIDHQMKNVQEIIDQLRQTIGNAKKQAGVSRLNQSSVSFMSKISSRKISLTDNQTVKAQLKNFQAKILNSRNKIDLHLQKNKVIQQEIDAFRKQIQTLKTINSQLQTSFKSTSLKYEEQMELSKRLDFEAAQKNQTTHRKKVQNLHKKAQMIKQYDVILKTLDRQIHNEKGPDQDQKSQFYLTDIAVPQFQSGLENSKSNQKQRRQVVSAKKPKINQIREKIKKYETQFEELKNKIGSENIEQITKKFTQEYQNNFHQYNFINQMYRQYEEANVEQFELLEKKRQLLKQLQMEKSGSKVKEIHQFRDKINAMNKKKQKIKKDMVVYTKVALELKVYLGQFLNSSDLALQQKNQLIEQLSDRTVAKNLHKIYEKHGSEFDLIYAETIRQKRSLKNNSLISRENVDDLIDEAKKQGEGSKDNRLLTRQDFQRNTLQLREKKLQASMINQLNVKYKSKKQIEKARSQNGLKKPNR